MSASPRVVVASLVLWIAGCKEQPRPAGGGGVRAKVEAEKSAPRWPVKGVRRLAGQAQELRSSSDGRVLTALLDAKKPAVEGVPPPMRVGDLWAVPTAEGAPVKVASGVTNLAGGWLHSPDGRWIIASGDWDVARQHGTLVVADASNLQRDPVVVSPRVTYAVPSDDGSLLGWVEDGVLSVGPLPSGPWRQVAAEVSTAEFSPDGRFLYFKRRHAAAGGLYQVDLGAKRADPRRLVDQVAEYTVLRSGKLVVATARANPADRAFQLHVFEARTLSGRTLSDDALHVRLSRDGRYAAWRTSSTKGDTTDVGALWLAELPQGKPRKLGAQVRDFEFSPDGQRLAFRENFLELPLGGREALPGDSKLEKVGDLHLVELPAGAPRLLQKLCPNFLFSPDGKALAYTGRIERPEVTRRLFLLRDGGEPVALKDWLYEYQFRPGTSELYYRADCTREGRSCDLLRAAPSDEKPVKVTGGVFGVRFGPDGSQALLASAHLTDLTFDLVAWDLTTGKETPIDQYVEWPALVLGAQSDFAAYLVHEKARAGVYVAPTRTR